jgi:hypothetical protein
METEKLKIVSEFPQPLESAQQIRNLYTFCRQETLWCNDFE